MAGTVAGIGWGTADNDWGAADIGWAAADNDWAAADIFGTAVARRASTAEADIVAAGSFAGNETAHW